MRSRYYGCKADLAGEQGKPSAASSDTVGCGRGHGCALGASRGNIWDYMAFPASYMRLFSLLCTFQPWLILDRISGLRSSRRENPVWLGKHWSTYYENIYRVLGIVELQD